ncbi:MAG: transketolase, partial [Dehalococcoidia bacterium]|nr:transketolase [Dehalococcoidia bacterium]
QARVVSMPSWEVFQEQPQSYKDEVLPPDLRARVSIEAAATFGWERYVGDAGDIVGLDRFGASAPYKVLYREFGFAPEGIAERAEALARRGPSRR